MLTRLVDARVRFPILVSGLIWSLYHYPVILGGNYANTSGNPVIAAALFACNATAFAFVVAWLRLWTGSVWPSIVAHAAWNTVFTVAFATNNEGGTYVVNESGALTIVVLAGIALVLWKRCAPSAWRRTPQVTMNGDVTANPTAPGYRGAGILCVARGVLSVLSPNGLAPVLVLLGAGGTFLVVGRGSLTWSRLDRVRRAALLASGSAAILFWILLLVEPLIGRKLL